MRVHQDAWVFTFVVYIILIYFNPVWIGVDTVWSPKWMVASESLKHCHFCGLIGAECSPILWNSSCGIIGLCRWVPQNIPKPHTTRLKCIKTYKKRDTQQIPNSISDLAQSWYQMVPPCSGRASSWWVLRWSWSVVAKWFVAWHMARYLAPEMKEFQSTSHNLQSKMVSIFVVFVVFQDDIRIHFSIDLAKRKPGCQPSTRVPWKNRHAFHCLEQLQALLGTLAAQPLRLRTSASASDCRVRWWTVAFFVQRK